jgi:hypothetical protein
MTSLVTFAIDLARFCFSIVVDLTGDEEAKELLERAGEPSES